MRIKPLDTKNASAHYDPVKYMAFVHYHGTITQEVRTKVYQWLEMVSQQMVVIVGAVFDFQNVVKFDNSSLTATQRQDRNSQLDKYGIPIAFLVANDYQKRLMQISMQIFPEHTYKKLVLSMQDAFTFIHDYNTQQGIASPPLPTEFSILSRDDVTCYYDLEQDVVFITYFGEVTPEVTTEVYAWMPETLERHDLSALRGSVFNFCHVTRFNNANLGSVRKTSTNINTKYDMSHVAVALLVGNMRQQQMVKVAMKVTPQEERKRIVKSYQEANDFITTFQAKRTENAGGD